MPNDTQITKVEVADRDVEIMPFGSDEAIKLNVKIVQNMIAVPTRQGHRPDATQAIKFMMLCKARHLNPFEGDAYLIGYDTVNGPQFSLITAHQVFLKRAEASKDFDGMESGVIISGKPTEDGLHPLVAEREGDLVYDGETLIGGWAKVYRKDRKIPFYRRIKLQTFNTGRSRWEKDPAGMIVKCAEADGLRSAFPTHLGGLYLREEGEPIDVTSTVLPNAGTKEPMRLGDPAPQNGEVAKAPTPRTRKPRAEKPAVTEQEAAIEAATSGPVVPLASAVMEAAAKDTSPFDSPAADETPLTVLRNMMKTAGVDETKFQRFLIMSGYVEPRDKLDRLPNAKTQEIVDSFATILPDFLGEQA